MAKRPAREPKVESPQRIRFHYLKGSDFRTIHADGAIGGLTPRGGLHIAFYAERFAIPTSTEHAVTNRTIGEELPESRVMREGIVREMSVDVMMTREVAQNLLDWLTKALNLGEGQEPK